MLTINLAKSYFGCAPVTYLGHLVEQGQIKPVNAKICAISGFPRPETKKQLMRFLGIAGYYRKVCPNLSAVAEPLANLLSKKIKFSSNEKCKKASEELKAILKIAAVLYRTSTLSLNWLLMQTILQLCRNTERRQ